MELPPSAENGSILNELRECGGKSMREGEEEVQVVFGERIGETKPKDRLPYKSRHLLTVINKSISKVIYQVNNI